MEEAALKNKNWAKGLERPKNPANSEKVPQNPMSSPDEEEDMGEHHGTPNGAPTRTPRKGARMISRKLSLQLLERTTQRTVDDWVRKVEEEVGGLKWPLVGNKDTIALMTVSQDEISPLVERITNAMDSIVTNFLEKEIIHGRIRDPHLLFHSPAEAASIILGIPMEYEEDPIEKSEAMADWMERNFPSFLRNFPNNDSVSAKKFADARPEEQEIYAKRIFRENFGRIADMIRVSTHDGSNKTTPTVVVRDYGIGQNPDSFEDTLLSILNGNKSGKPWTHGKFGIGSCLTYFYSSRTIIISRREDGEVGVSVIKREGPIEKGPAVHMTDADGQILRLDLGPEFPNGTEIRMVDYQLQGNISCITERTNSLRQTFNSHFIKPTLPFLIEEFRTGMSGKRMRIRGFLHSIANKLSAARIKSQEATDDRVCIYNPPPHTINLKEKGSVKVRLIVLNSKAKKRYYMMPDEQICFSLNGQRHHSISRNWFRELGFPNLYLDAHVVVECDGVHYDYREDLLTSTRNNVRRGELLETIMNKLKTIILEDERLLELEEEAKIQKIGLCTAKVSESVIDEIKKIISEKVDGTTRKTKNPPPGKKRDTDDSRFPEMPTTLKIDKNPFKISQGRRGRLYVNLDAKNGYLPMLGRNVKITLPDNVAKEISVSGLEGGKFWFSVEVPNNAPLGEQEFEVTLEDDINEIKLSDKAKIVITKPSEKDEEGGKDKSYPEIEIVWVERDNWANHSQITDEGSKEWDENSVGECQINPSGSLLFLLNRNNTILEHCSMNGKFTPAAWTSFLNRYTISMTTALYDAQKDSNPCSNDRMQAEKERLARLFVATTKPELMQGFNTKKHSIPKMDADTLTLKGTR